MDEERLNERLKAYYHHKNLPKDSLANLKKMIEQENTAQLNSTVSITRRWHDFLDRFGFSSIPRLVSVFTCLLLVSLVTWQIISKNDFVNHNIRTTILKEITMNHKKSLIPEFKGVNIQTLGSLMPELDFSPVVPDIVTTLKLKFLGARYCSINGNLAVQLKLETSSGNIYTLYQTLSTKRLLSIKAARTSSNDVEVKLWHEKGLFMAIAGSLK